MLFPCTSGKYKKLISIHLLNEFKVAFDLIAMKLVEIELGASFDLQKREFFFSIGAKNIIMFLRSRLPFSQNESFSNMADINAPLTLHFENLSQISITS